MRHCKGKRNRGKHGLSFLHVCASQSIRFAAANTVSYVAPSLGAWLGYTSASATAVVGSTAAAGAAAGTAGSIGAFSAVSGAAGASVAGYKMTRRTAGVSGRVGFFELWLCPLNRTIMEAVWRALAHGRRS